MCLLRKKFGLITQNIQAVFLVQMNTSVFNVQEQRTS